MNKHWEIGEKNKYGNECYNLHFTQFYDDEIIISFVQDKDDNSFFIYVSNLLNVEYDYLESETIEEAKEECKYKVREYIQDQVSYYEDMLEKFEEE